VRHPFKAAGRIPVNAALFAALVALSVVPLFAGRYLPFFDYPAHLTIPAALRQRADPATQISALWERDWRIVPNCAHYAFTYLLSFLMPLEAASRLFVALFSVAALPVAAAFTLRAFGRDWRLAVLAVPLAWNRCLWYGFVGFCAALPLSLIIIGLLATDLARPSRRRAIGIGLLAALLPFVHFFVMMLTLMLAGALMAVHVRRTRPAQLARTFGPLLLGPLLMAPWFLASLRGGPQPAEGAGAHLFASRPRLIDYAALLRHWFIDGYLGRVDDALAVILIVTLAALLLHARRAPGNEQAPAPAPAPAARSAPLALAGALLAVYLTLPFEIRAPFNWWGMNVRVIPLAFVWLLVTVPPGALDRFGRALLIPAGAATAAFMIYLAVDVSRTFNGPWGMAGIDDVLAKVPPGARVMGLYTDYRQPPHYAHYPFHYATSYAVLRGAALGTPFIPIPQSWTNPRVVPPYPFAGDAALFDAGRHAAGYTHFLVRTCTGQGCVADPLAGKVGFVRLAESGRWRLYDCAHIRCGATEVR
jgi:hypothetical protein